MKSLFKNRPLLLIVWNALPPLELTWEHSPTEIDPYLQDELFKYLASLAVRVSSKSEPYGSLRKKDYLHSRALRSADKGKLGAKSSQLKIRFRGTKRDLKGKSNGI